MIKRCADVTLWSNVLSSSGKNVIQDSFAFFYSTLASWRTTWEVKRLSMMWFIFNSKRSHWWHHNVGFGNQKPGCLRTLNKVLNFCSKCYIVFFDLMVSHYFSLITYFKILSRFDFVPLVSFQDIFFLDIISLLGLTILLFSQNSVSCRLRDFSFE